VPLYKFIKQKVSRISLLLFVLFSVNYTNAQPGKKANLRVLFTQASLMMDENFNDSSLRTFQVLYKMDSTNANVGYYIGQLYLGTPAHKADALPYLEKAVKHITVKYIPNDPYEKNVSPLAYYFLARAQHINYQFDSSIANFNKFKTLLPAKDKRQKDISYWITCCNNGKELMKSPVDCKIINLGDSINSSYPDYSPVISADEQELLFTSRRPLNRGDSNVDINGHYYEDIWISYAKPDKTWTTALNLGFPVNTPDNDASVSLSPDGQQLIMFQDSKDGSGRVNTSYLRGFVWTYPQLVDSSNMGVLNNNTGEASACMSPDRKTLFFVSNRAGGLGGTDIYKVSISDSGKWGKPVNLGANVNTEYDEDAPFIHYDDSTMFFSSKGHNTMGGFDVFMSKEDASGQWGPATNLGYPINTPDDDIFFSLSADGRRGYYTTIRKGGYGERDIYEVVLNKPLPVQPVAVLVGYIKTPDGSRLPNDIKVTAGLVNGKNAVSADANYLTGKFLLVMRPNENYNVVVTTQGKTVFNHNFYLPADSSYFTLSRAFFRTAIILGDTNNVFAPKRAAIATPVANVEVKKANMSGKLLLNDDPLEPLSGSMVKLEDGDGKVLSTTLTNPDGSFTFGNLTIDKKYIIAVNTKDTRLKHLKKLLLVNASGQEVRNYDKDEKKTYYYHNLPVDLNSLSPITQEVAVTQVTKTKPVVKSKAETKSVPVETGQSDADFVRYFGYNQDKVSAADDGFNALIDKITTKIAAGEVKISIEASASKVPTKLFSSSNKKLAQKRAVDAKKAILITLKNKGIDPSKLTIDIKPIVGGPRYEHDAGDESKYQKFQYVKVYIN
jgi:hypothetical protein